MPFLKISLIAVLMIFASACQKDFKEESKTSDLSYQFNVNGCDTGKISYSSDGDLCNKLKDDSLNKGCAYNQRLEMFNQRCGGQAWVNSNFNYPPTTNFNPPSNNNPPSTTISTYKFTQNGCSTGVISHQGGHDLCEKLQNDELNNFCAQEKRYDFFKSRCQNYAWNGGYRG